MFETDMSDWAHRPNGDIVVEPVVAWAVGAAPDLVLLRLEIHMESGEIGWSQLGLPADVAADLAKALRLKSKRAQTGRSRSLRR